jgi:histidine triad (HIT) family protein
MATIFTRIIDGELPGTFVWRDDRAVGLMSINPLAPGHVLVVPTVEVDHWIDLDAELAGHLFEVGRVIGVAQAAAFDCARVGLIVAGYEVPHTHVHVIPTTSMAQLNFANAAVQVDPAALETAAEAIRKQLRAVGRDEVTQA